MTTVLFIIGTVVIDALVLLRVDNFFFLSAHVVRPWAAPLWISVPHIIFYTVVGWLLGVLTWHAWLSVLGYLVGVLWYYYKFRFGEFWIAPGMLPFMILVLPYAFIPAGTIAGVLLERAMAQKKIGVVRSRRFLK